MSFTQCCSCGHKFGKGETIYSDGGMLEINHGGGQCRDCYAKSHPFCSKCDLPLSPNWKFCPHCGLKMTK